MNSNVGIAMDKGHKQVNNKHTLPLSTYVCDTDNGRLCKLLKYEKYVLLT